MTDSQIRALVQQEVQQAVAQLKTTLTQFGAAKSPIHYHNNVDLPNLPPTSLSNVQVLSAQPNNVLSEVSVTNIPGSVAVFPVPVLQGGATPAGIAPEGTLVLANPGLGVIELFARAYGTWTNIGP